MIKNKMMQGFEIPRIHVFAVMLSLMISMVVMYSCQKDFADLPGKSKANEYYDDFGPKLERVISASIQNHIFKAVMLELALQMTEGDTEVLLSTFLGHKTKVGVQMRSILMGYAQGVFAEEELNTFMDSYPSVIIGLRGNLLSWAESRHVPPVVFVNSKFKESEKSIQGTQSGTAIVVSLQKAFEDAVIAIRFSERHDSQGIPLSRKDVQKPTGDFSKPAVDFSKNFNCNVQPEPTSCPTILPAISSISGEAVNGGIRIQFTIANFPEAFCYWGKVKITRSHGPNTSTIVHNGPVPSIGYLDATTAMGTFWENSNNISPNINYTYLVEPRVEYIDPGFAGLIVCSNSNISINSTVAVTAPQWQAAVTTFNGQNGTGNTLDYNWAPPSPTTPIETYRIQLYNGANVSTIFQGNATSNYFSYPYLPSMKGQKVTTAIDHKTAASPWQPKFIDESYASWRVSGQPLFFHGIRMIPVSNYETQGPGPESPINGLPEIRLTAVRALASSTPGEKPETSVLTDVVIPMSACVQFVNSTTIGENGQPVRVIIPIGQPGYFVPADGDSRELIHNWDSDLIGSSINISLFETDINETVITEETEGENIETSANYGIKVPKVFGIELGLTAGVETAWKTATTRKIRYPITDIPLGTHEVRYYEPLMAPRDFALYGVAFEANEIHCIKLQYYLNGT